MLSWIGKLKDTTAHASPTRTHTHVLPVHLVHSSSQVPDPQIFTSVTNGPGDPLPPSYD